VQNWFKIKKGESTAKPLQNPAKLDKTMAKKAKQPLLIIIIK
jgi:hypothetical protein